MRKDGLATREKILDAAGTLIMESGYGGTTIDEVIEKSDITKGAFFHHFKSKEDMAKALVQRYAETDRYILDRVIQQAEERTSDPVQQLLAIVDIYIEMLSQDPHAEGCMYASYCYESGLLEESTLAPIQDAVVNWRNKIMAKISAAAKHRAPRVPIDPPALADNFLGTFEGGFILARTMKKPSMIVEQLKQFRTFIAALFAS